MSLRLVLVAIAGGLLAIGAIAQQPKSVPQPAAASPKTTPASPTAEMRIAAIEELAAKLLKETQALKAELKAVKKPTEVSADFSIYRLKFSDAMQMTKILSAAMDAGDEKLVRIVADPTTNSLLIRGAPDQLKAVEAILMRLDVEGSGDAPARSEFLIFELKHGEAADTAKLLKELLPRKNNSNMRIVADTRTNSILVYAAQDEINFVKTILLRLDDHAAAPKKIRTTIPIPLPK
jgi:type II secretory pathway component GspD/PulD (secretin)